MLFQALDAVAHRAVSDMHLFTRAREIQVPRGRFEEAKRLERGKYARHAEMIAALTAGVRNHRWPRSHRRSIMRIPNGIRFSPFSRIRTCVHCHETGIA